MNRPSTLPAASRLAIVGTAGHIDHGKTALVRRLTGVDTDRLPEEKSRGISIDIGFAPLVTPGGAHVGLVDVPGHERFVKNMLAGVGGVDRVLLVIAADEGVMPQTREHLAIVRLLGVQGGVVVLTKADLVTHDWMELVKRDVRALLAGTPLAAAPMVEFSAVDGRGQEELLAALDRQLEGAGGRDAERPVRLPVDRVFTMEGFGTVVTGTLWRGTTRVGDALELLPSGRAVRVRRIQVHGATVEEARAGQRTALALHGVERDQVIRGDWVVFPGSLAASRVLDVRFELLPDYPRPWPAQARVRFHLGAGEHLGRLVLLEGGPLAPGGSALAQIRLERATAPTRGDRFVIRSYSPARTVGGGTVIEPVGQRRRRTEGLAALAVHESGSLAARLLQRLEPERAPVATATLARALSESETAVAESLAKLRDEGAVANPIEGRWLSLAPWQAALTVVGSEVEDFAARHPARFGISKGELKSGLKRRLDPTLFDAVFAELQRRGALTVRSDRVRPSATPWEPPAATMAALEKLAADLEASGFAVAENKQWEAGLGAQAAEVMALGLFLGHLVRVTQELTYTSRQLADLEGRIGRHFATRPTLGVADFKDLAGVSRKYAVPLLEHADRSGWTTRVGDLRKPGHKFA
jgi:selenocysteine-specific elongation factor